ncbi:MAG: hypothetical protein WDN29_07785 [Methylovirgula sp.]
MPANTTFDTIRVVGHDLVLVQKDGTAIVFEDAGDKIPNIEIGDVDVPKSRSKRLSPPMAFRPRKVRRARPRRHQAVILKTAGRLPLGNARGLTGLLGAEGFNFNGTSIHFPPPASAADRAQHERGADAQAERNPFDGGNPTALTEATRMRR